MTGDLTEAKDEAGRGGPRHEEWQVGCTADVTHPTALRFVTDGCCGFQISSGTFFPSYVVSVGGREKRVWWLPRG